MRVIVNITSTLGKKTGIGYYVTELLHHLSDYSELELETFPRGLLLRLNSLGSRVKNNVDVDHTTPGSVFRWLSRATSCVKKRTLRTLRELNRITNRTCFRWFEEKHELYHEPNYVPYPSRLPTIATIPDLSVLLHPEWHPADRARYFEKHFHQSLPLCRHFLAISDSVNREIVEHLNIEPERVTTTPLGIRDGLYPLPRSVVEVELAQLKLPKQYLLYLGTLEPRKNLLMLLKAYCDLPESIRADWPLLLVGKWGWNTTEIADYYHTEAQHRGVIHLGYIPDEAMPIIYNGARVLLFPSHYEGFGLPPLEMMACGGGVICSTADALMETAGDCAHVVPPDDLEGWRDAMQLAITDREWWDHLRQGTVEHAAQYTWERCAETTMHAYRQTLQPTIQSSKAA